MIIEMMKEENYDFLILVLRTIYIKKLEWLY